MAWVLTIRAGKMKSERRKELARQAGHSTKKEKNKKTESKLFEEKRKLQKGGVRRGRKMPL